MQARQDRQALADGDSSMFRAVFDSAGHGIALVALDGHFIHVNAAFCRMVGYSRPELQQLYFHSLTHPDDLEISLAPRLGLIAGEAPSFELEKRYIHKSGHIIWVKVAVNLVRDEKGAPLHFVCQLHDVTDPRATEERLN